jgi:hypothetical protein
MTIKTNKGIAMLKNIMRAAAVIAFGFVSLTAQAGIFSVAIGAWDRPDCSEAAADLTAAKALLADAHALTDNTLWLGEGQIGDQLKARVKIAQSQRQLRAAAYDLLDCGLLNVDVDILTAELSLINPLLLALDIDVTVDSVITHEILIKAARASSRLAQVELSGLNDEDALNNLELTDKIIDIIISKL